MRVLKPSCSRNCSIALINKKSKSVKKEQKVGSFGYIFKKCNLSCFNVASFSRHVENLAASSLRPSAGVLKLLVLWSP